MQTDEPPATDMHTGVAARDSSPLAIEPVKPSGTSCVKAEDKGMQLGDVADGAEERQQAQPRKPQEQQQGQPNKPRQQPIELDLGDPAAQPDTADAHTDADAGVNSAQQQQQQAAVGGKIKVPTPADLQAALLSAAAAAATTHGSTAVSPYVQGASAAAAALANAGLNLADSPHAGGAVEQDTPHPGALVPEAAAAAMAAAPPSRLQVQSGNDHRVGWSALTSLCRDYAVMAASRHQRLLGWQQGQQLHHLVPAEALISPLLLQGSVVRYATIRLLALQRIASLLLLLLLLSCAGPHAWCGAGAGRQH